MDKLDAMNAFAKVVAAGSYAEAARRLGLTRSAVSKAVMELEQVLGARLLDRTTRRVTPTEAGRAYYERCSGILADVEETEDAGLAPARRAQGACSRSTRRCRSASSISARRSPSSWSRYPELKIELMLNDRFIDPLEEGVDVTVRIGALPNSSLIARRLAPARRVLVAAPGLSRTIWRAANAGGSGAASRLDLRAYRRRCSAGNSATAARPSPSPITSCLCSNNGDVLRTAALDGNGIAILPTFLDRPRHHGGQADGRAAGLSADRTRHLCALCAQPLSGRQDARVHRLPERTVWAAARLG